MGVANSYTDPKRAWLVRLFQSLYLFALLMSLVDALADEAASFSPQGYRISDYRSPLPTDPPAGQRIDTQGLQRLMREADPILIDVLAITLRPESAEFGLSWLPAEPRLHLPGSVWLPNVGYGDLEPCMRAWLERRLRQLTGGDPERALVFYCVTDCWMSWNAVKRAGELGYSNLHWYAEGTDAWMEAGLTLVHGEPEPLPTMRKGRVDTLFECPARDLKAAMAKSNETAKQGLMLFFETDHCPFCKRMRAGVLADPVLIDHYREHFISAAINLESEQSLTGIDGNSTSAKAVARALRVVRTPTLIFLNSEGEESYRYSGLIVDPREFRALADYVSGGLHERMGFKQYLDSAQR